MEKKTISVTITQFDYIIRNIGDEEVDINGHLNQHSEFDPEGRLVKEIKYNRQGEFEEMIAYQYDEHGHLVRESYYPAEDEMAEEKSYIWNDSDRVIQSLKHYQDGSVDTTTYEYLENGQLSKLTTISDEGETEQVETFEWDGDTLVNHEIVDGDGELVEGPDMSHIKPAESRVTRNDKGQSILEEELDEEGEVFMTVKRSYRPDDLADEVDVSIDGRGRSISRHYFLKYEYTFYE